MSQLADWKCVVKAGKVMPVQITYDEGEGNSVITVEDVNGAPCKIAVPGNFFSRGTPHAGDYIVIYEDGYKSWYTAMTFEDGYTRL